MSDAVLIGPILAAKSGRHTTRIRYFFTPKGVTGALPGVAMNEAEFVVINVRYMPESGR